MFDIFARGIADPLVQMAAVILIGGSVLYAIIDGLRHKGGRNG